MRSLNKTIAITGILTSLTIILGFIEHMIPLPIPGIRLGLANIGIMLAIYALSFRQALSIALLKSILIPILTGNLFVKMIIGLPATLGATLVMYGYYRFTGKWSSPLSTGALGGFIHICIQFMMIKLFLIKSLSIYTLLPYFSIFSILSGIITGYIVAVIYDNFKEKFKEV